MKLTSIITVNFNQPGVTLDFLKSVKNHASDEYLEVILVDNGSKEDFESAFKNCYPNLIYIKSGKNLGFAGGNNLGIKVANGDYLLLLNNDTEITTGMVSVLKQEMELRPEVGMVSPLILYYSNPEIIQYAGFTEMNYLTCRNRGIGNMETDIGQFESDSRETGYCHGAAMMVRRTDLDVVGLMSEDFFLYYEELDWCEKFKKAGKILWFTGKTKIYHKESMSVGKESAIKTYFMTRNRMLFIRKNTNALNIMLFSFYFICIACTKQVLLYLLKKRFDLIKWVVKGVFWNLTNSKNSNSLGVKI